MSTREPFLYDRNPARYLYSNARSDSIPIELDEYYARPSFREYPVHLLLEHTPSYKASRHVQTEFAREYSLAPEDAENSQRIFYLRVPLSSYTIHIVYTIHA